MDYLSIQEYANLWNISKRRIQILCKEGRIPGVQMIGNMWVIPEDIERPLDARFKNPIIETAQSTNNTSTIRKELKKLLKRLFESCSAYTSPDEKKDYILSLLAGELCAFYLEQKLSSDIIATIYKDISNKQMTIPLPTDDAAIIHEFIYNNQSDPELDNILSWAYQYSNKYIHENVFSKTQFFTEKYMINFLVKNMPHIEKANKILDPCVGGGNFLVECLEVLCNHTNPDSIDTVLHFCSKLFGYDIDNKIAKIAVVNIRLRALAIMHRNRIKFDFSIWHNISPNIYMSKDLDSIQGSLTKEQKPLCRTDKQVSISSNDLFSNADIVLTNPPFATIKGMKQEQKDFLKKYYPLSNCDTCVAFIEAIEKMLSSDGTCGIVSQNAWMHLHTFNEFRIWAINNYSLHTIINLGSGAFQDLNGEKSNVSLIILSKRHANKSHNIQIANINKGNYEQRAKDIEVPISYYSKPQWAINGSNGFDFAESNLLNEIKAETQLYRNLATPMQGTSTGNSKELVGFFWEHFGDHDWINVSNGGGYCRWQGLNDSVVKWGKDGEYIKAQKGSALRNIKYFPETQMVFSDTGTAGLNVRLLHDKQIFIASGPGIRIHHGNKFAHLALLNSRIASYFIRLVSPKLTIAAGYIGQIPVTYDICTSVVLEKNARACVEIKEKALSIRANNIEYTDNYISPLPSDLEKASWALFNEDITNELLKLELEWKNDIHILDLLGFSEKSKLKLDEAVGQCAYEIRGNGPINLINLDNYFDKLLDSNCTLKRTKSTPNALGSDGYLEYAAKDLHQNPENIVRNIQANPFMMKKTITKYMNLLLHNYVLHCLGYNTAQGLTQTKTDLGSMSLRFNQKFNAFDFSKWIKNHFNQVHTNIFKQKPFIFYDKGEVSFHD